ncbi:hypothetical protein N7519_011259 [Penicillium mononematosum]|uniref:uncharacterized protein n=1 Tax=Penicillium mononematosum TaxID=268346 RepID=UPI0025480EB5|nr:uncharacterized protein N7519_011259 [Penicillium mononematosum]KAJ6180798.1 hypothetical protein N7519_011259 [Penicillium mononematosum]
MTRNLPNTFFIHPFKAFRQSPWAFSSALPSRIDASLLVEEENSPYYEPAYFYPRIGEILNDRWRWSNERYMALKINSNNSHARKTASGIELEVLRHITKANRHHEGWGFVRKLLDSFSVQGTSGSHICLVFEPLHGVMPPEIFKIIL